MKVRLFKYRKIATTSLVMAACCAVFGMPGNVSLAQTFTSGNLPIVVLTKTEPWQLIDSAWDGFEIVVHMGIIDNGAGNRNHLSDPYNNYNGLVKLKVQGSSSVAFPKRSFRLTTLNGLRQDTDASLLGMPAHEDWVLKALYQDKSLIRDDLAFRIYNQMGHYSSRSRFCEVVVDGDYRGVYQLLEKVKRGKDRVNISKLRPEETTGDDLTGGYIISLDKYTPADQGWHSRYRSNATGDSSNYFLYYYPKPDSMPAEQKAYIKNYFDRFEEALASESYASPIAGYRQFIDLRSFVDNFIINELSRNVDGYRASTFFFKDKESSANNKLQAGPIWDFNIAFGNASYNHGNDPYWWAHDQFALSNFVPWWWKRFMTDSIFKNELRCRYMELRGNILSEQSLYSYIDSKAAELNEAQARNFTRYPILGQVIYPNPAPAPATWESELAYLKWWLHERLLWMDNMINGNCITAPDAQQQPLDLQGYPNPFYGKFSVGYKASKNMHVKIELLDMVGHPAMMIYEGVRDEGSYEETANTARLPAGNYLMKVSLNGTVHYRKLFKIQDK